MMNKRELKQQLDTLREKRGFHTELISLYIPADKPLSDVSNYLKHEMSESQNIRSKQTRKNVLDGIAIVKGQLAKIWEIPDDGLAIFSGAIPQHDQRGTEKNETYLIHPPAKIATFRYWCDDHFYIEPLEAMLHDKSTYGLITISRKRASVGYIQGNRVELMKEFTSGVHGKHSAGGQSSARFDRLLLEQEKRFHRRVARYCNRYLRKMDKLVGVFVGGSGESKKRFVRDKALHRKLKENVVDIVDLPYDGGYEAIRALINKTSDRMQNIRYIQEQKIADGFMEKLTNDSGLAIYGYEELKRTITCGAAELLILTDENALEAKYRKKVKEFGGTVKYISTETEGGKMIETTFGGAVAVARYRV